MSPADLKRLVRIGEGYHLEFKRRVSSPGRIAREAIALANTWGGAILVGVDDDGSILGVKDTEEELFDLRRALADHCEPPIPLEFETVPVTAKREVIVVTVEESDQKPHAFKESGDTNNGDAFVRVDEHTLVASPEMKNVMRHEKNDDGVKFEFGESELMLLRYLETYGSIGVEQFAKIAGLEREAASAILVLLTRASVLRLIPTEKGDQFIMNHDAVEAEGRG